ncbi:MAG TPA: peptide-methionine (R)-S-oxide reductase, partial [Flavobacteriaceae bacterium]|nr:peptide-methionine (R)-S-oxide reductase [Flavobacteriaceae bacterium]
MFSCKSKGQDKEKKESFPVTKTEAEWKAELSDMEYYVLREAGTERAFSSSLNKE